MLMTNCANYILLELTPVQRLDAIRKLDGGSKHKPLYIGMGVIAIIVVGLALITINRLQRIRKKKSSHQIFAEAAEKYELTEREVQLSWSIAVKANLQHSESIFTLPTAFSRGDGELTQECLSEHGQEESECLQAELSSLRKKLGFDKKCALNQPKRRTRTNQTT